MHKNEFKPGFRLSILDIIVLIVGILGVWYFREISPEFSSVILFVVCHFFYFCNITRMSRIPELVWATCFVLIYGAGVFYGMVTVNEAFIISIIVTLVLTFLEIRKPSYHGIFWLKINPNLKVWFENRST